MDNFGKIIGPLGLAMIVGSSNIDKPLASVAKIVPAFTYLGMILPVKVAHAPGWQWRPRITSFLPPAAAHKRW
jgi:hypothetical protein